ncbi:MAG: hypothetical protein AAYR33_08175 [Acetobacteraceae bacterium]
MPDTWEASDLITPARPFDLQRDATFIAADHGDAWECDLRQATQSDPIINIVPSPGMKLAPDKRA